MSFPQEEHNVGERHFYIVVALFQYSLLDPAIPRAAEHLHSLGQIDISAARVLFIDRCDHEFSAQIELILDSPAPLVIRMVQSKRAERRAAFIYSLYR